MGPTGPALGVMRQWGVEKEIRMPISKQRPCLDRLTTLPALDLLQAQKAAFRKQRVSTPGVDPTHGLAPSLARLEPQYRGAVEQSHSGYSRDSSWQARASLSPLGGLYTQ